MRKEEPILTITEEKKEKAVSAFMFIKKSFKDIMAKWGFAPEVSLAEKIKRELNEK